MKQDRPSSLDKWCMFSLWLPVGMSLVNLWRVVFMDNQDLIVAIISAAAVILAALIAGIITLIVQSEQLKRDGKTIDETKTITSDMHPKINNIDYRTEKQTEKLEVIVADIEYRKRLEATYPKGVSGRDLIDIGTQQLINEGSALNLKYQELSLRYQEAQNRIMELNTQNSQLRSHVSQLKSRLKELGHDCVFEP